jgi:hypothetical protein
MKCCEWKVSAAAGGWPAPPSSTRSCTYVALSLSLGRCAWPYGGLMAILDIAIATKSGARMRGAVCAQRPRHHESPSASASVSCCGSARFMMRCLACWSRPGEAGRAKQFGGGKPRAWLTCESGLAGWVEGGVDLRIRIAALDLGRRYGSPVQHCLPQIVSLSWPGPRSDPVGRCPRSTADLGNSCYAWVRSAMLVAFESAASVIFPG